MVLGTVLSTYVVKEGPALWEVAVQVTRKQASDVGQLGPRLQLRPQGRGGRRVLYQWDLRVLLLQSQSLTSKEA